MIYFDIKLYFLAYFNIFLNKNILRKEKDAIMNYIENRTIECAKYLILNNSTIRKTAKKFNLSKSTLHQNIHKYLIKNDDLYVQVVKILDKNFKEKHIRGGETTKNRYKKRAH